MNRSLVSRRRFLSSSTAGLAAATLAAQQTNAAAQPITLNEGDVVLFQGDSITDAGRDKKGQNKANDARALGTGYPFHLGGQILAAHPKLNLKVYNRGISGHKVPQLDERWQTDTLDLNPAVLSILIGVNDIWHKLSGRYDGTAEVYRDGLAALLARTKEALPNVRLVICEPFVLRCGAVKDDWFPEFDVRRQYALDVAKAAGAIIVPFQTMFNEAVEAGTPPEYWARDGVHPSVAGHALMAQTWREIVGI